MVDQAQKLRELVEKRKLTVLSDNEKTEYSGKPGLSIAVTSGKGGVGKTNITANLAIQLSRQGHKVIILDSDFSLANIDVLLGITPRWNMSHVFAEQKTLEEILIEGPYGIQIIPASSGLTELAQLNEEQIDLLLEQLPSVESKCDYFFIDTAAGIADQVLSLVCSADMVMVVTTPEPTAYTDAYAMIKVVGARNPDANIGVLINMAQNHREAQQASKNMVALSKQFLHISVNNYGYILRDPEVSNAIRHQEAFSIKNPHSLASRGIRDLAQAVELFGSDESVTSKGLKGFFDRWTGWWKKKNTR